MCMPHIHDIYVCVYGCLICVLMMQVWCVRMYVCVCLCVLGVCTELAQDDPERQVRFLHMYIHTYMCVCVCVCLLNVCDQDDSERQVISVHVYACVFVCVCGGTGLVRRIGSR